MLEHCLAVFQHHVAAWSLHQTAGYLGIDPLIFPGIGTAELGGRPLNELDRDTRIKTQSLLAAFLRKRKR